MGGALDSSRFRTHSMALDKPANDISAMVMVDMNTTMIPLTRLASYNGIPVSQFFSRGFAKKLLLILW
jgi:malate dehydrogenase